VSSEDGLDDTKMSLIDHLTELRARLIKGFLAVLLTTFGALAFAEDILDYSIQPLLHVLQDRNKVETILIDKNEQSGATLAARLDQNDRIHFHGKLKDLGAVTEIVKAQIEKKRPIDLILVASDAIGSDGALMSDLLDKVEPSPYVAYLVRNKDDPMVSELQLEGAVVLLEPLRDPVLNRVVRRAAASAGKASANDKLVVLSPLEPFIAYLKIAFVVGLFLACPFWLYQTWSFVAPGLYATEKKVVVPSIASASFLFCMGGLFAYYVMFPLMFDVLVNQLMPASLTASFTVDKYLGLLMEMTVAFGLVFELPLILAFLAAVGIVSAASLRRFRKYWIIAAFIIGAVLTPADPISQSVMALPLIVFYEVGILLAVFFSKKREQALMDSEPIDVEG
jgi:Tat protein translocase TatC